MGVWYGFEVLGEGLGEGCFEEGFAFVEEVGDGGVEVWWDSVAGEVEDFGGRDGGIGVADGVEFLEEIRGVSGDEVAGLREGEEGGEVFGVWFYEPCFPCEEPAGDGGECLFGGGVEGGPAVLGERVGEGGGGLFVGAADGEFGGGCADGGDDLEG